MAEETSLLNFLKEIDDLVLKIEQETPRQIFADSNKEMDSTALIKYSKEALDGFIEPSSNGFLDFTVSEDGMSVNGDFYPPGGAGLPLTLAEIEKLLTDHGILWGIHWPLIRGALMTCNADLTPVKGVLIAAGIAPTPDLPERWEILKELLEKKLVLDQEAAFLDFKTISPFVFVKKGDLLANVFPAQEGSPGTDLKGVTITYTKINPSLLTPGSLVVKKEMTYVADSDGCFKTDGHSFWIEAALQLDEGVSYKTGHIDFQGDVYLKGDVAPGFKIYARGDVYSSQVIDATEIIAQGNVTTGMGIIGREGSIVKSEGRVRAKFLENVYVLARESIEVQISIMNCFVRTFDRLILGPKGLLMGGKVESQNGLDLFQVGSDRGGKAQLICGMDFSVLDKIIWIRDQKAALIKKLKFIELEAPRAGEKKALFLTAAHQVQDQITKLTELSAQLINKIDRNEEAQILIRGTIFPGNYIEICHVSTVVSKPLSHVRFFLDKRKGLIIHEPL